MHRSGRINKDKEDLNNIINKLDLMDIFRKLYPTITEE